MATVNTPEPAEPITFDKEKLKAATRRGELLRLFAVVDTGQLTREQVISALDEHERSHPAHRLLMLLLGK